MEISTNKQTETVTVTQEKLSLKEKVSYGFGDFGNGFMFDLGQLYLLKFFTDVAGIPAAAAGGIFLVSKLFAAFVDPIVGTSIDYRKNIGPKGKFRPYLLYGSFVLAILTILTFISPNLSPTGKLIYAYASYMLWGLGYSFVNIPYGSLGAAMTQNSVERTSLASFRQAGSLGALFVTSIVVIPMIVRFDNPAVAYPVVMGLMSFLGVLFFYICYRNCQERIVVKDEKYKQEKVTFKAISKTFFTNKPLLTLIFMTIFTISAYNLKSAMLIYFAQYNLGNAELMAYMNFIIIGSSFIGVIMLPKLVKLFGKKHTAILGLAVSVCADLINFSYRAMSLFLRFSPASPLSASAFRTVSPGHLYQTRSIMASGEQGNGKKERYTRCLTFRESWLSRSPASCRGSVSALSAMCRMRPKKRGRCSALKRYSFCILQRR